MRSAPLTLSLIGAPRPPHSRQRSPTWCRSRLPENPHARPQPWDRDDRHRGTTSDAGSIVALPARVPAPQEATTGWRRCCALTGFLPSLALLSTVVGEGPMADYAVALSEGGLVLLTGLCSFAPAVLPGASLSGPRPFGCGGLRADTWAWARFSSSASARRSLSLVSAHPYERSPQGIRTLPAWPRGRCVEQ